ncbi:MAG: SlyX family protein [Planctomycetes bacterium]|nr:SlyX family protein [Planctomycetota bacterium]MCB9903880.1 SlyX family protein [Planctomycetota bacterium]
MSDRIEARLIELESRLIEQERVIEHLNDVIIEQGRGIEQLEERLRRLTESISGSGADASGAHNEPPPPHY